MTNIFSWQNSVSLCPTSFCTPSPNLPVTPSQVTLYFPLLLSNPLWWKGHLFFFFLPLVLEGLIGLHRTETEDIKKRWKEYTELYKKDLHDPDNHDGVIIHLDADILECKVKWASGSITTNKASGGDGIPGELFQILKDGAVKVLHSVCQQIWKTQQWPQDWKRSAFISIPKKGNDKECSNYCTIALISHASKVMLKILQARLQQYVNCELPDVQAGFRKGRGTRDQIANTCLIIVKG